MECKQLCAIPLILIEACPNAASQKFKLEELLGQYRAAHSHECATASAISRNSSQLHAASLAAKESIQS
jgi:hypothetical protein